MNLSDTSWYDDLLAAALKGDADTVEDKLYEDPSNIDATFKLDGLSSPDNSDDEATLLDIALRFHYQEMALVVMPGQWTQLASSDAIDLEGLLNLPPLHPANLEDALLLIASGTDADVKDARGNTCLHTAAAGGDTKTIESFLQAGANVNAQNARGRTPLHMAVLNGSLEAVRMLLEKGGSTTAEDSDGHAPISLAFDREESILYHFDVFGENARELCAEMIEILGEAKAKQLYQRFLAAVEEGDLETVQRIQKSEDINYFTETYDIENTSLHIAAKQGHDEIVTLLLEAGADVDAADAGGYTALAHTTRPSTVRLLLDAGDTTPYFLHVYSRYPTASFACLFLDAGVPPNQCDETDDSLLSNAASLGDDAGVKALLAAGADANAKDDRHTTALHRACFCEDGGFQALLEAGADIEARDDAGTTPLLFILDQFYGAGANLADFDYVRDNITQLLNAGASVNVQDKDGTTPLHLIGRHEDAEDEESLSPVAAQIIKRVVSLTADLNAADNSGATPLSLAEAQGNLEVARLLRDAGAVSTTNH